MAEEITASVQEFVELIKQRHGTIIEVREILTSGKSGAIVALVDCSGKHDGIYILKIGSLPKGWEDEETLHRRAIAEHAFSDRLPAIVLSERTTESYCLILKIAGESRITWRPLVGSLGLFRSAYAQFGQIAWTPALFSFDVQLDCTEVARRSLGYRLVPTEGGRIGNHVAEFLGKEFLTQSQFIYRDELLPNPFWFVANPNPRGPIRIRPLLGPVHGDAHAQNIFVRAREDATVRDVHLIDMASYKSKALFFFDHAYLELSALLRQMEDIGERRWLNLANAAACGHSPASLEQLERGWVEDIYDARAQIFREANLSYPDRGDDLKLQFMLAQVAAGLDFLNKVARTG